MDSMNNICKNRSALLLKRSRSIHHNVAETTTTTSKSDEIGEDVNVSLHAESKLYGVESHVSASTTATYAEKIVRERAAKEFDAELYLTDDSSTAVANDSHHYLTTASSSDAGVDVLRLTSFMEVFSLPFHG